MRIEYCAEGVPVSDFALEDWFATFVQDRPEYSAISSSLAIERVQLGVLKGEIGREDVVCLFEDQELHIGADGMFDCWPKGFCDIGNRMARAILEAMCKPRAGGDISPSAHGPIWIADDAIGPLVRRESDED